MEARCAGSLPGPPLVMLTHEIATLIVKCVARRPLRGLSARSAPSGGVLVLEFVLGLVCVLVCS